MSVATINNTWLWQVNYLLCSGNTVNPRGKMTKEVLGCNLQFDMRQPVLTVPARKLSYSFMAAEAWWILTGDNRVETIRPHNRNIAQFSDDGIIFHGAYGPKIASQIGHVVSSLIRDESSRQAGLTIWRENPPLSKDIPCTVAMFFYIRGNLMHTSVFMRSSDVWLGLPYDVFNFSMVTHKVCAHYNAESGNPNIVSPGVLTLSMGSSHIYESNMEQAENCLRATAPDYDAELMPKTPEIFYKNADQLVSWLSRLKDSPPTDPLRWWQK